MKKFLLMLAVSVTLLGCNAKPNKAAATDGNSDNPIEVNAGEGGADVSQEATSGLKFVPTGNLEADAEMLVRNSLKVTQAMLKGNATQQQQEEASQMLVDAVKYYNSLDEAKGKEFQRLVSQNLLEHTNEYKVDK